MASSVWCAAWSLAACVASGPTPWGAGTVDPVGDSRWIEQVSRAGDAWNTAAECLLIEIGEIGSGNPVELVSGADWPDRVMGRFDGDSVRIRAGLSGWELPVVVHELGHALGLEHVDPHDDPASIMRRQTYEDMWTPSTLDGIHASDFCPDR